MNPRPGKCFLCHRPAHRAWRRPGPDPLAIGPSSELYRRGPTELCLHLPTRSLSQGAKVNLQAIRVVQEPGLPWPPSFGSPPRSRSSACASRGWTQANIWPAVVKPTFSVDLRCQARSTSCPSFHPVSTPRFWSLEQPTATLSLKDEMHCGLRWASPSSRDQQLLLGSRACAIKAFSTCSEPTLEQRKSLGASGILHPNVRTEILG